MLECVKLRRVGWCIGSNVVLGRVSVWERGRGWGVWEREKGCVCGGGERQKMCVSGGGERQKVCVWCD